MVYMLMFNDPDIVDGAIAIQIRRPVSFQTFLRNFVFDHEVLVSSDKHYETNNITGVLKMEKDFPYDYELTMDGKLIANHS